ncbi:alpha/beta fold hydrolase [Georgenia yuyongxinii]|uniref:alpha/beta fold hydrolase n=1 Tax=Georgenia yuyongxinii TaxID=2589797 RepID=UPI001C8F5AEB|nr:alpha/beta hydrolase [Georgenia yuyongxinii]
MVDVDVEEGTLRGGLPYLRLGRGPVLVDLPGIESRHANPTGQARALQVRQLAPLAEHFEVWAVRRPPGVPAGVTMADIAAVHAEALTERFGEPVRVLGTSTGASIALQLAADHPATVRRLVLLAGACRLSEAGRAAQRRLASATVRGEHRRAWAATAPVLTPNRAGAAAMAAMMWLTGPAMAPDDPTDMLRVIEAEDAFDVTDRLHLVQAPTLVIGGARDGYYGAELFRRTAAGIPGARLVLHPRRGHMGVAASRRALQIADRFLRQE